MGMSGIEFRRVVGAKDTQSCSRKRTNATQIRDQELQCDQKAALTSKVNEKYKSVNINLSTKTQAVTDLRSQE